MNMEQTKGGLPGSSDTPNDTDLENEIQPDPMAEKFDRLEKTINTLASSVQGQAQRFNEFQTQLTTPRKPQRSREELSELYEQDPMAATQEVVGSLLDQKLTQHTQQMTVESQKLHWDNKARSDFPIDDTKFYDEMNSVWKEMAEDGYDVKHPKALYRCAKEAASRVGFKKSQAPKKGAEYTDAEAPFTQTTSPSSKTTIRDDDPRVAFYKMRPGVTTKKIEDYKKELLERDKAKKARGK